MNKFIQIKHLKSKLTIFMPLLLCFIMILSNTSQARANNSVATQVVSKNVSLNIKNKSISYILTEIKKQTGIGFFVEESIDAKLSKLSVNVENISVDKTLNMVLKNTEYQYYIKNNSIIIDNKEIIVGRVAEVPAVRISGVVVDPSNKPIAGATIIVFGGSNGAITTSDGKFYLNLSIGEVIEISYSGMKPQKHIVRSAEKTLHIRLEPNLEDIGDVVITGYQVLKKRELTSSIVSLKAEDIIESVGTSVDQMLQGKVAGMSVTQMTSTVGAAPKIRIRGSSTILGSREPLWVLDGVVLRDPVKLDATELNSMDQVNLIGNAISGLNPEDIERIDVLKDASATAIYGTKAANGVIVITTKRGKEGAPRIRYSTSLSFMDAPSYDDTFLMNSNERIGVSQEMHNRGLEFAGFTPDNVGYEGALQRLYDGKISTDQFNSEVKRLKEVNTDWYDLLFRNSFSQSHTASVSGGSEKVNYYFSGGYSNQQGSPLQEQMDKFSFMSNLGFKITKKLSLNVSLNSSISDITRPTIDLYEYANTTSRAIPAHDEVGENQFYTKSIAGNTNVPLAYNIFNELEHTGSISNNKSFGTNINLSYKPLSWLSLDAIVSYNTSTSTSENYVDEKSYDASVLRKTPYGYDLKNLNGYVLKDYYAYTTLPFGGTFENSSTSVDFYTVRPSIGFNKEFGNGHSISGTTGMEIQSSKVTGIKREQYGYLPDRGKNFVTIDDVELYPAATDAMLKMKPELTDNIDNSVSYYAALSYGFKSKYILSLNTRGDASNKLGDDKDSRFKPIWAVSARWNLSDEEFMTQINKYVDLAFRGSFGYQANITDEHNPNMIIGLGSLDSNAEEFYATLTSLPNRGLLWERTRSYNVGIDFSLLEGRISGSFEYYRKESFDQLMSVAVPSTNGANVVTINGGDLSNQGWDISVNAVLVKTKDVTWNISMNTGKVKNQVNNAADRVDTYDDYLDGTIIKNGNSLNSFYSYRFNGLDSNGFPTFAGVTDVNEAGEYVTANRKSAIESAMVYSGNREPIFSGGFSTSFRYKKLSFNAIFAFGLGALVRLDDFYESGKYGLPYPHENMSSDFNNRWRKPGDENFTNIPTLSDVNMDIYTQNEGEGGSTDNIWREVAAGYNQMYNDSDLRVASGSYLRCRSLSASYSLSSDALSKMKLGGISFGLSVSNPFVFKSKELQGRDPEQIGHGSGTLPPQQSYALTLSLTF